MNNKPLKIHIALTIAIIVGVLFGEYQFYKHINSDIEKGFSDIQSKLFETQKEIDKKFEEMDVKIDKITAKVDATTKDIEAVINKAKVGK
ncbi:hypothetical protein [Burkholderia contaminans]|uniref:hypothetical protein n=1 Tax=Burkholderia contaminans TaxID=488447 RepID=UPI001588ECCF|nr:hypothetical protein [Burkholderia contaminans]